MNLNRQSMKKAIYIILLGVGVASALMAFKPGKSNQQSAPLTQ
jgi:hypothetical protein